LRPGKGHLIARLRGVSNRDAAERLCKVKLYIPRARLPAAQQDEFYHADLIGLSVATIDGTELGQVIAVHNFGAGDLIEVRPSQAGATVMLPFTESVVPQVDIAAGRLIVNPLESLADAAAPADDDASWKPESRRRRLDHASPRSRTRTRVAKAPSLLPRKD
jgi:16S rRNA processing protein RimM